MINGLDMRTGRPERASIYPRDLVSFSERGNDSIFAFNLRQWNFLNFQAANWHWLWRFSVALIKQNFDSGLIRDWVYGNLWINMSEKFWNKIAWKVFGSSAAGRNFKLSRLEHKFEYSRASQTPWSDVLGASNSTLFVHFSRNPLTQLSCLKNVYLLQSRRFEATSIIVLFILRIKLQGIRLTSLPSTLPSVSALPERHRNKLWKIMQTICCV